MHDYVVYTTDVPGLVDEALALGFTSWLTKDEAGEYTLAGDRTDLIIKWPAAMALIRITDPASLGGFTKMQVLGQYDEDEEFLAVSPTADAIYRQMYDLEPRVVELPDGTTYTVEPPKRIGSFA